MTYQLFYRSILFVSSGRSSILSINKSPETYGELWKTKETETADNQLAAHPVFWLSVTGNNAELPTPLGPQKPSSGFSRYRNTKFFPFPLFLKKKRNLTHHHPPKQL